MTMDMAIVIGPLGKNKMEKINGYDFVSHATKNKKYYLGIEFQKPYYEKLDDDEIPLKAIENTIITMERVLYDTPDSPILYFDYYGGKVIDVTSNIDTIENIEKAMQVLKDFYGEFISVYVIENN